jgi:hypothetical protein
MSDLPLDTHDTWPHWRRILFRFYTLYFLSELFHGATEWIPFSHLLAKRLWPPPWYVVPPSPSWLNMRPGIDCGPWDAWCYKQHGLWAALLAIVGTIIWTLSDSRRPNYNRLHAVVRLLMRYTLAYTMLRFAWFKLAGTQFWTIWSHPHWLAAPFGSGLPHDLAWNTFGFSYAYGAFTGFGELTAGVLLLFRRSTTLGALLTLVIMATVSIIDVVFGAGGITWKAIKDTMMAAVLVAPDVPRLWQMYVRNAPVPARGESPLFDNWWRPWLKVALTTRAVIVIYHTYSIAGYWANPHPLSGAFDVVRLVRNGQVVPNRFDDSTRWQIVDLTGPQTTLQGSASAPSSLELFGPNGNVAGPFTVQLDTVRGSAILKDALTPLTLGKPKQTRGRLSYERLDERHLVLKGELLNDTVELYLRRRQTSETVLFSSPRIFRGRFSKPEIH